MAHSFRLFITIFLLLFLSFTEMGPIMMLGESQIQSVPHCLTKKCGSDRNCLEPCENKGYKKDFNPHLHPLPASPTPHLKLSGSAKPSSSEAAAQDMRQP
nr:defensin-like protein [Ipomoea batatas]